MVYLVNLKEKVNFYKRIKYNTGKTLLADIIREENNWIEFNVYGAISYESDNIDEILKLDETVIIRVFNHNILFMEELDDNNKKDITHIKEDTTDNEYSYINSLIYDLEKL